VARKIAVAGSRRHLWREQHKIEPETKGNHLRTNSIFGPDEARIRRRTQIARSVEHRPAANDPVFGVTSDWVRASEAFFLLLTTSLS
jgi:hypothetical protein